MGIWRAAPIIQLCFGCGLQTGLDVAYDVPGDRKFVGKRLVAFILMFVTLALRGIARPLIVFGATLSAGIESHVPFAGTAWYGPWSAGPDDRLHLAAL